MGYTSIEIHQNTSAGMTFVPNVFIDRFMTKAPGEYVKVYLYLLRCLNDKEACFSFAHAAHLFDSSEGDIRRALNYWEDESLLVLERSGSTITGISLCCMEEMPDPAGTQAPGPVPQIQDVPPAAPPDYPPARLRAFSAGMETGQVVFVAEQYLGHHLNHRELCYFYYWKHALSFSADLIIDLVDQCVCSGCTDLGSMHALALSWHAADVHTPEDARVFRRMQEEAAQKASEEAALAEDVCSAMGIAGRTLNDEETARLQKWSAEWGFSSELICEACRRTVSNTHQASFEYADTVLRNWHAKQITDMDAVRSEDEAFRTRKTAERRSAAHTAAAGQQNKSGSRGRYGDLERLLVTNI